MDKALLAIDLLSGEWIKTDADTHQYGRKVNTRRYQFKENIAFPSGHRLIQEAIIDLDAYTDEEISEHISSFGYTIDQLKSENGLEVAEWLMAECIFEIT